MISSRLLLSTVCVCTRSPCSGEASSSISNDRQDSMPLTYSQARPTLPSRIIYDVYTVCVTSHSSAMQEELGHGCHSLDNVDTARAAVPCSLLLGVLQGARNAPQCRPAAGGTSSHMPFCSPPKAWHMCSRECDCLCSCLVLI